MSGNFGMQSASGHLTVATESKEPYAADVEARLRAESAQIIARYPQKRSALLPMLHLIQSEDGYVTGRGIDLCAELLDLSAAEVSGVATFYTQYKRHPNGTYTVGVCTNTLCAIMGGDEIWDTVSDHLGIDHDETTDDGAVTLERVECNAACDYAPVVMVNWEFFDNQTPQSTIALVDDLQAGRPVRPTRGPDHVPTFKEMSHTLAGFLDGLADQGVGAGPASLIGLEVAHAHDWTAPPVTLEEALEVPPPAAPAVAPGTPTAAADATIDKDVYVVEKTVAREDAEGQATLPEIPQTLFSVEKAPHRGDFEDAGHGEFSAKPGPDGAGPLGWDIKGNAGSGLFHTPESPWYARTIAEIWFRDIEAAIAAGFIDALERRRQGKGKDQP